jgi:hypothetical protein
LSISVLDGFCDSFPAGVYLLPNDDHLPSLSELPSEQQEMSLEACMVDDWETRIRSMTHNFAVCAESSFPRMGPPNLRSA